MSTQKARTRGKSPRGTGGTTGKAEAERAADRAVARRLFEAVNLLERRMGHHITQAELGALVAKKQGRSRPYSQAVITKWLSVGSDSRRVLEAWAAACGVSAGWLAFNEGRATLDGAPPVGEARLEPVAPAGRLSVTGGPGARTAHRG